MDGCDVSMYECMSAWMSACMLNMYVCKCLTWMDGSHVGVMKCDVGNECAMEV